MKETRVVEFTPTAAQKNALLMDENNFHNGKTLSYHEFQKAYNEELLKIKLSRQIKDIRASLKLTQKEVASKTRMPQSVVARIESGEHGISLDTLGKIAHSFGKEIQLV